MTLTKVDADDATVKLPGAVFKLEERRRRHVDGRAGYEALTTDGGGLIRCTTWRGDVPLRRGVGARGIRAGDARRWSSPWHGDTPGLAVAVTALNAKSPVLGKAVLTKVDADDATVKLPGAVFKLEQRLADGTWATVPGNGL